MVVVEILASDESSRATISLSSGCLNLRSGWRIVSTGQCALRTTRSATLPIRT